MIRVHHPGEWRLRDDGPPGFGQRLSMEFEQFEHGADVGVRGFGSTPAEAFRGAAHALFLLLAESPSSVRPAIEEQFELEATGLEELLVAYLNELISLSDTKRLVFGDFEVEIRGGAAEPWRLAARARGEPFDAERHESTVQPKGATYTAVRVAPEAGRWVAQCVVDV